MALVAALALIATGCGLFDDPDAPPPTLPPPPETDVAYGPAAGCPGSDVDCGGSQQLDIYRSDEPGPNPVLVYFHGGGFIIGDKSDGVPDRLGLALRDGWDVVAANYRLATPDGDNLFPTAVNDARRAIRWVKANADAQGWDASNVAVMGQSAGGNLAEMLAVTSDQPEFDPPDLPPELVAVDPSVIAAVAVNPVSDLGLFASSEAGAGMVARYTGCNRGLCRGPRTRLCPDPCRCRLCATPRTPRSEGPAGRARAGPAGPRRVSGRRAGQPLRVDRRR